MNQTKFEEKILQDTGTTIGETALAIAMIVQALKKQPGFDVSNFDSALEKALPATSETRPVTAQILKACLSPK